MNKIIVISNKCKLVCDALKSLHYNLIYSECVDEFISYEQNHADMQCISVEDTVIILKNCRKLKNEIQKHTKNIIITEKLADSRYPDNILLNTKIIGKYLIGRIDSLDKALIDLCTDKGYRFIDVNQGYSACSILKVTDNAIITTDESIYRSFKNSDMNVLKITQRGIDILGARRGEQGFIGGASINLDDSILFFGDIRKHENYDDIRCFCGKYNIDIKYIEGLQLSDLGGGILLNISQ